MDETINTQDTEVKDVVEGTVEAEVIKNQPEEIKPTVEDKKVETVPLAVYLDLKKDLKELKESVKESNKSEKSSIVNAGIGELTSKYPDVSADFIKDMLNSATIEATKTIEAKYSPIIEKQEIEKKQALFDAAFNNLFDKTLQDNPDLPKTIDKELVKTLASTPKYKNVPLSDILIKMYGQDIQGKASSENEMRSGADRVDDIVSFDKITADQKKNIMNDPKSRAKYFNWLDTQTGR